MVSKKYNIMYVFDKTEKVLEHCNKLYGEKCVNLVKKEMFELQDFLIMIYENRNDYIIIEKEEKNKLIKEVKSIMSDCFEIISQISEIECENDYLIWKKNVKTLRKNYDYFEKILDKLLQI